MIEQFINEQNEARCRYEPFTKEQVQHTQGIFLMSLHENDMHKLNRVFLCKYKLYINNFGTKIKLTNVRFHQRCKYYSICHRVKVTEAETYNIDYFPT